MAATSLPARSVQWRYGCRERGKALCVPGERPYQAIRNYFNALCKNHQYRVEKYANADGTNRMLSYTGKYSEKASWKRPYISRRIGRPRRGEASRLSIGSFHMGDTYSAGQAGAIGPGATASQLTFQQVWAQLQGSTSVEELAKQLGALRMAMRSAASEPEHELSIGAVAAAEAAAKAGDGVRTLEYLKKAGNWALDVATKIEVNIASSALKGSLGLP